MRCMDAGARAFWQMVGLTAATLCAAATIVACLPMALSLWFSGTAASRPGLLLVVTALTTGAAVILVIAGRAFRRSSGATRALRRELRARRSSAPENLLALAAEVGLSRVEVVNDVVPFALTYGVRHPRVAVSSGLIDTLSADELAAVLAHEQSHVECRDPLRMLLAAGITMPGFCLPALPALRARFVIGRELAADRRAMERYGRRALAGALLKVVDGPRPRAAGAAAMAEHLALDARLTQLETGTQDGLPRVSRFRIGLSLLAIVALGWGAITTSTLVQAVCGC